MRVFIYFLNFRTIHHIFLLKIFLCFIMFIYSKNSSYSPSYNETCNEVIKFFSLFIVTISKPFSIVAFTLSKSRLSGSMIFRVNLHQKHSLFFISTSSLYTSGCSLLPVRTRVELFKDTSISSSSIPATGATTVIALEVSKISTAI